MMKLYECPPTRSQRAKWALEELGIDYASQRINMQEGEQNSDAYRSIHPLGVVPTLETDDYTIFESVAIAADRRTPQKNWRPRLARRNAPTTTSGVSLRVRNWIQQS